MQITQAQLRSLPTLRPRYIPGASKSMAQCTITMDPAYANYTVLKQKNYRFKTNFITLTLKKLKVSQKLSLDRFLSNNAFISLGDLQKSPESAVLTCTRGTARGETERVDRGGTCKGKGSSNV